MILLNILSYITDMLLIFVYMNKVFRTRKPSIPKSIFYISFIASESALMINQVFFLNPNKQISIIATSFISIFSIFALCFLYETNLRKKIIYTIIFQLFSGMSEYTIILFIRMVNKSIFHNETSHFVSIASFCSKIILFLLIIIFTMFLDSDIKSNFEYHIFSLITPIISLIILNSLPLKKVFADDIAYYDFVLLPCIIILNITNYLILERIKYTHGLELKNSQLEQQLNFQQDKYLQLSAAYKNTRRVVHDTKKHHFVISKYIEEKRYDELKDYVNVSYKELENTYAVFNTGNLVIDAFLSNYKNLAKERSINFHVALNLEASRIPVKDYDLCIILGNLLDNSFNACEHIDASDRWIDIRIYIDNYDKFRIDCRNSVKNLPDNLKPTESLEHGFGTANIYRTVKKNLGTTATELTSDTYTTAILIPIIDTKQRLHPPKKY